MLPHEAPPEGWDAVLADDARLAAGVAAIAQRHGLGGVMPRRYDSGSVPVYALGEQHVLKLFPPNQAAFADVESRVLALVAQRLPLPTPDVKAVDALEGWHYILMTQLRGARALLHTEVMREHLMVERAADGWRLSGLLDFEPAMIGDPAYEFASVGLFVACGDARFLRRTLRAYGSAPAANGDDGLACRYMAHALLHRYSNLPWYLQRLPPQGATTLAQLAHQRWWALE